MILRTLTAALLSAALALSSTAAPAAADSRDRDRLIGTIVGIGALAVIANELAKDRKKDDRRDDRRDPPRPGWGGHDSRFLPAACAFEIRDRDGGRRTVLGKTCLDRSFRDARRLPRDCAFEIRDRGDRRTVYGERCLERAGYRIARGRH